MIEAQANLLAITPEVREKYLDWKSCLKKRIEAGYEWAPAEANARRLVVEVSREAAKGIVR